jgi:putative Mg2+ transporter-C (MgtC) family protein
MESYWLVSFLSTEDLFRFILSCAVAVVCGLIIGLDRESKGKPAGLRTLVLICVGSCIFTQASVFVSSKTGDPGRIAAQIVSGIGFLGAGAILQKSEQGYIAGLTTAASIWVTAAVGMLAGLGHYIVSFLGTFIVIVALQGFGHLEGYLFYDSNVETRKIYFESNFGKTKWELIGLLEDNMIKPDEYVFQSGSHGRPCLEFRYVHKNRQHRAFLAQAASVHQVLEIV